METKKTSIVINGATGARFEIFKNLHNYLNCEKNINYFAVTYKSETEARTALGEAWEELRPYTNVLDDFDEDCIHYDSATAYLEIN